MARRSDGLEPESDFLAACNLEERRIGKGWAPFWRYLELGRYGQQLASLYRHFPADQVHVVRYREIVDDPVRVLDDLAVFLNITPGLLGTIPGSNMSAWAPPGAVNSVLRGAVRTGAPVPRSALSRHRPGGAGRSSR